MNRRFPYRRPTHEQDRVAPVFFIGIALLLTWPEIAGLFVPWLGKPGAFCATVGLCLGLFNLANYWFVLRAR